MPVGHEPDPKARRKRREREARQAKTPTARELFGMKRDLIAKNRADLEAKLKAAPKPVQDEYRRCLDEIGRLLGGLAPGARIEDAVIYPTADDRKSLLGYEIVWLQELLVHRANGWDVKLSSALGRRDDRDARLLFRFDPYED